MAPLNISQDDFKQRFSSLPELYVKKMRPQFDKVNDTAILALLMFPEMHKYLEDVLENAKAVTALANRIKQDVARKLFLEVLKSFDAGGKVDKYDIAGKIRNVVYFIQDDPVKELPEMKKTIKYMIDQAEKRQIDVMEAIRENSARMPNQKEAIAYAYAVTGKPAPKSPEEEKKDLEAQAEKGRQERNQATIDRMRQERERQQGENDTQRRQNPEEENQRQHAMAAQQQRQNESLLRELFCPGI